MQGPNNVLAVCLPNGKVQLDRRVPLQSAVKVALVARAAGAALSLSQSSQQADPQQLQQNHDVLMQEQLGNRQPPVPSQTQAGYQHHSVGSDLENSRSGSEERTQSTAAAAEFAGPPLPAGPDVCARSEQRGNALTQHLAALCAANVGVLLGMALGWTSAALSVAEGGQGFPVSLSEWSWVSSLMTLGSALGAAAAGLCLRSLGRRPLILLVAPVSLLGWALHVWATQVWMLYLGRALVGLATGAGCVASPVFVCEVAEPRIRGALSTYLEVLLTIGILAVYVMGKWVPVFWMNMVGLAFSALHGLCFLWFPETPRWFLIHKRYKEARKALIFYRGDHYDVDTELRETESAIAEGALVPGLSAFGTVAARRAVVIAVTLMLLQQVTGINAITFYATQMFQEAGSFDVYIASMIVGAADFAAACVSVATVDWLGRRALLLLSAASMAVCTGLLGGYFFFKENGGDVSTFSWLPIIFASLFKFTFTAGFGAVSWVVVGEIFPDSIKSAASASATSVSFVAAFLVTKLYPGLSYSLGKSTCYWIFCGLCVASCVFFVFCMPETKGRSLDEIQADLSAGRRQGRRRRGGSS